MKECGKAEDRGKGDSQTREGGGDTRHGMTRVAKWLKGSDWIEDRSPIT